jgi:hypothetical protein
MTASHWLQIRIVAGCVLAWLSSGATGWIVFASIYMFVCTITGVVAAIIDAPRNP